jgi:hypothetical protein
MPNSPVLTIDFGSIVGSFHATANDLPAIAALSIRAPVFSSFSP